MLPSSSDSEELEWLSVWVELGLCRRFRLPFAAFDLGFFSSAGFDLVDSEAAGFPSAVDLPLLVEAVEAGAEDFAFAVLVVEFVAAEVEEGADLVDLSLESGSRREAPGVVMLVDLLPAVLGTDFSAEFSVEPRGFLGCLSSETSGFEVPEAGGEGVFSVENRKAKNAKNRREHAYPN